VGSTVIIEFPYDFNEFEDKQELWSLMAISALRAGLHTDQIIIAYA